MLLKTFIDGLIYDLSIIVRAQQPKTFQNALDIALTVESDVGFPRKTSKNCNYCKTNTHDTRECRLIRNRNTNEITNNLNRPQTNYSQKPNLRGLNNYANNYNRNNNNNNNSNFNNTKNSDSFQNNNNNSSYNWNSNYNRYKDFKGNQNYINSNSFFI